MTTERVFETKNSYVEQAIRDALFRGEIRPGMWLRSEEWAIRLKTSLTPVREALRKLEAEGLVKIYPHRGARVAGLSRNEFEEVYQLRSALEGLAAWRCVSRLDEEGAKALVARLEHIQDRMNDAIAKGELGKLRQANKEFHMAIYEGAQSSRLYRLIENLWATFPWDTLSLVPGRPPATVSEHLTIVEAVRNRDPEAARHAVGHHIDMSSKALISAERTFGINVFDDEQ